MDKTSFDDLLESVAEADAIMRHGRAPSRRFEINPVSVREIREMTELSQENFARLIHVQVGTLRNWEQGRREPTGPAKALLQVIRKDPRHVMEALAESATAVLRAKPRRPSAGTRALSPRTSKPKAPR